MFESHHDHCQAGDLKPAAGLKSLWLLSPKEVFLSVNF